MSTSIEPVDKPQRRWLSYSLRSLYMVLTLFLSVPLGWLEPRAAKRSSPHRSLRCTPEAWPLSGDIVEPRR